MDPEHRRNYLEALGIQCWLPRASADESVKGEPEVQPGNPFEGLEPPVWLDETPPFDDTLVPASLDDEPLEMEQEPQWQQRIAQLKWPALQQQVRECERCELHKSRTQTVFGIGNHEADLLIIGEAPGVEEDRKGEPFVGRAGQLLNAMLLAIGLKREAVYIANILKCRPPNNRDPRPEEVLNCEVYLRRQLALVKPKVILCVGRVAAQNLLKSDETVGRMRGQVYEYDATPVIITYHPAYLLRSPTEKAKAWKDLQLLATRLGR